MSLAEFAADTRATELALTRAISPENIFGNWGALSGALPNPDPVLRRTGQSITVLDEIRRENHVAACSESREAAVTKKKWAIERGDASERAAEVAESVFKNLNTRQVIRELCEAWGYGYQISQIIWGRQGDLLLPERVCALPRSWFSFGARGELRLLTKSAGPKGEEALPYQFLVTQHRATFANPYGESKYSSCFWPVTFKKGGLKFWAVFLEKFGMPHALGKMPRAASDKDRAEFLDALSKMIRDAVAVIPDEGSVELKEANVTASSDAYAGFLAYHDGEISTAILGHSAGATSTPGRLGGEDLALQVRADITENDAEMVSGSLYTLIRYIHELNPSLGEARPSILLYDEKDVDKARAERDGILMGTGQVRLTKKYFVDRYGFGEDEIEVVEPAAAPMGAQFAARPGRVADPDRQAQVDGLAENIPEDAVQTSAERLLNPVFEAVKNADTFAEFEAALHAVSPDMDDGGIADTNEKVTLIGAGAGKLAGIGSAALPPVATLNDRRTSSGVETGGGNAD
jgi:phage gp29-like protein